jgi:hypothetical protein
VRTGLPGLAVGLLVVALEANADVAVQVREDKTVDIRAQRAPLRDVLEALSEKTGIRIVYQMDPPRELVSFSLVGLTARAALTEVLRGQGLTYAFTMAALGEPRVQTLVLTASGTGVHRAPPPVPAGTQEGIPTEPGYYEETIVETPRVPEGQPTATPAPMSPWIPAASPSPAPTAAPPAVAPAG